jgi:hypothetical protein
MSDELKGRNLLKLILIVRFACAILDVGHPRYLVIVLALVFNEMQCPGGNMLKRARWLTPELTRMAILKQESTTNIVDMISKTMRLLNFPIGRIQAPWVESTVRQDLR